MNRLVAPYPIPPPAFGKDGGDFFHHYDKLQDDMDDDMYVRAFRWRCTGLTIGCINRVKSLKDNLDGLLTFVCPSWLSEDISDTTFFFFISDWLVRRREYSVPCTQLAVNDA